MKRIITAMLLLMLCAVAVEAQRLKVALSPDRNKINRDFGSGVATVVFDSSVKGLQISNDFGDERIEVSDKVTVFLIPPESEESVEDLGYPTRDFLLKTSKIPEIIVKTPPLRPNSVTYYTVTMPNQFPLVFSAEYIFSKSAKYGVRLCFGAQFGGFVSYKWGEYVASGNNIGNVNVDVDLTKAEYLGYIRRAIVGGPRFGLMHRRIHGGNYGLYLMVGGGYGEYGRQWRNPTQISNNIYFYTDYMRGFDGELAVQITALDWLSISMGADLLEANGKVSVDYAIGVGLILDLSKFKKSKL